MVEMTSDGIVGFLNLEEMAIETGNVGDGDWDRERLVEWLKPFDGKRVRITVEVIET